MIREKLSKYLVGFSHTCLQTGEKFFLQIVTVLAGRPVTYCWSMVSISSSRKFSLADCSSEYNISEELYEAEEDVAEDVEEDVAS